MQSADTVRPKIESISKNIYIYNIENIKKYLHFMCHTFKIVDVKKICTTFY